MKPMRVLNCTKRQREAIFAIADEVGCFVDEYTKTTWHADMAHIQKKDMTYDGKRVIGWHGDYGDFNNISFSEFITELMKYEKPKVWVKRSDSTCHYKYDIDGTVTISFVLPQNINSRYHTMTYEAQEK